MRRQSDHAYEALKSRIISLALSPGEVLNEQQFMDALEVGRTPLREAVQRLASEGLITVLPRRGMQVTPIRPGDVRKILEVRVELEALAARSAAERASEQDLADLYQLRDEVMEAGALDPEPRILFDQRMHELIARAAANEYLFDQLMRIYAHSVRLLHFAHFERETLDEMRGDLDLVLDAIVRHDGDRAAHAWRRHIVARMSRLPSVAEPRSRASAEHTTEVGSR